MSKKKKKKNSRLSGTKNVATSEGKRDMTLVVTTETSNVNNQHKDTEPMEFTMPEISSRNKKISIRSGRLFWYTVNGKCRCLL